LLEAVGVGGSRECSIASSVRSETKAFSLFGEAMGAALFAITLLSLSISHSRYLLLNPFSRFE